MGGHCGVWTHTAWPKLSLLHLVCTMTFHQMLKNASFYFRMLNSHLLLRPMPNWAAISISSIFKRESWGSPSLQNYILCLLYFRWESEAGQQRATCPIDISNWLGHSTSATEGQQKVQQSPCCYWGFAVPAPPHQDSKLISRWQGGFRGSRNTTCRSLPI